MGQRDQDSRSVIETFHYDHFGEIDKADAEAVQRLEELVRRSLGDFDTGLLCNCGKANITDHARVPTHAVPLAELRVGPQPSAQERLAGFSVQHEYYCDACGLGYKNRVIEEARGYVPQEKQTQD